MLYLHAQDFAMPSVPLQGVCNLLSFRSVSLHGRHFLINWLISLLVIGHQEELWLSLINLNEGVFHLRIINKELCKINWFLSI